MKQTEKKFNFITLLFWIAVGIISLLAVFFVLYNVSRPFKVTKIDNMKQTTYETFLNEKGFTNSDKDVTYYVYITNNDQEKEGWYNELVIEYANYARTHSDSLPIYHMSYDARVLAKVGTSTSKSDLPGLILIKNKEVSQKYLTYSKLSNELTKAMNK